VGLNGAEYVLLYFQSRSFIPTRDLLRSDIARFPPRFNLVARRALNQ